MRVLAPLNYVDEVKHLINAGADELYCGVLSAKWLDKYSIAAINRRPALICNLQSFDELHTCAEIAHDNNVSISLTINEHYYTQTQYSLLLDYMQQAIKAGTDSFIISDLALLLFLKEQNFNVEISISTGGTIFNSESAMFYQSLGATKITIPRHLTLREIEEITKNVYDLDTCVFLLNSRCPNIDGFCTFMHFELPGPMHKHACMLPYSIQTLSSNNVKRKHVGIREEELKNIASKRQQIWQKTHMDDFPCGLCALYEFKKMGIDSVKIVGRGNPIERKVHDIESIQYLLSLLNDTSLTKEIFRDNARKVYSSIHKRSCRVSTCYYPEVMSNEGNIC